MQPAVSYVSSSLFHNVGELLSLRAEGVPISAAVLLGVGLLWFAVGVCAQKIKTCRRSAKGEKSARPLAGIQGDFIPGEEVHGEKFPGKKIPGESAFPEEAPPPAFSFWGWGPPFLCTALGGCLLFLFCEDQILAAGLLFLTALLYALLLFLARPAPSGEKINPAPSGNSKAAQPALSSAQPALSDHTPAPPSPPGTAPEKDGPAHAPAPGGDLP